MLWISPTLDSEYGGPTTTIVNGLLAENRAGARAGLATTCSTGHESGSGIPAIARLRSGGVPVKAFARLPVPNAAVWGLSPRMLVWMIRGLRSSDVVHLQSVWCMTTVWGCLLAPWFRVPVVLTAHESLTGYDIEVASGSRVKAALKRMLRTLLLRRVDVLVQMSELERRDTDPAGVRTIVIPHAVAEEPSQPGTARPPVEPGLLRIAFLGRNVPKKGLERLIRALADARGTGWRLSIAGPVGDARTEARQKRLARELGVDDRVEWLGFVPSAKSLFEASDVLAMPSEYEGFGMAAAEAMAAGMPVIVPARSGVAELVGEFEAGLLIERPTVESLADTLAGFDAQRPAWSRMGHNGTRAVNERLLFEHYAAATGGLYASLVADSGSGRNADSAAMDNTSAAGRYT